MPLQPPPAPRSDPQPVDVLIVGALTIDRFADGSTHAGGSVLHAARAIAAEAGTPAVVTIAGDEPDVAEALDELRTLGPVHVEREDRTVTFRHATTRYARELVLERRSSPLACPARAIVPAAVLYAPVAAEFGAGLGGQTYPGALRTALLQGWLRALQAGRRVDPLPLGALAPELVAVLSSVDVLVASVEDLAAVASSPGAQLDALRNHFPAVPLLVVTDGPAGAWLDRDGRRDHLVPRSVVSASSTVGAGDAFAAVLTLELSRGAEPYRAAERAGGAVARLLESRVG